MSLPPSPTAIIDLAKIEEWRATVRPGSPEPSQLTPDTPEFLAMKTIPARRPSYQQGGLPFSLRIGSVPSEVADENLRDILQSLESSRLPPLPITSTDSEDLRGEFAVREEEEEEVGQFDIWKCYQQETQIIEDGGNKARQSSNDENEQGEDLQDDDLILSELSYSIPSSTPSSTLTSSHHHTHHPEALPNTPSPHCSILRRMQNSLNLADELKPHLSNTSSQPSSPVPTNTDPSSVTSGSPPHQHIPRLNLSILPTPPLLNGSPFALTEAEIAEISPSFVECTTPTGFKCQRGPERAVIEDAVLCEQRFILKPWTASFEGGLPDGLDPAFPPMTTHMSPYTTPSSPPSPSTSRTKTTSPYTLSTSTLSFSLADIPIPHFPHKPRTTTCRARSCPINHPHEKGPYLHSGKLRTREGAMFGASNPPPEIWEAYGRMKVRIAYPYPYEGKGGGGKDKEGERLRKKNRKAAERDEGVVVAFARCHFAETLDEVQGRSDLAAGQNRNIVGRNGNALSTPPPHPGSKSTSTSTLAMAPSSIITALASPLTSPSLTTGKSGSLASLPATRTGMKVASAVRKGDLKSPVESVRAFVEKEQGKKKGGGLVARLAGWRFWGWG